VVLLLGETGGGGLDAFSEQVRYALQYSVVFACLVTPPQCVITQQRSFILSASGVQGEGAYSSLALDQGPTSTQWRSP
jgi:hypothetical protein